MSQNLPDRFASVEELDDFLARPGEALVADLAKVPGDIAILGAGGKMGPSLARLARRAAPDRRILAVARFSEPGLKEALEQDGITCIACDLMDRAAVAALPQAPNVIFMAGRKFGSQGAEHLTWAMNVLAPALVAEHFCRSRIVAFSTGCVYPFVPVTSGGATEDVPPAAPAGDYAWSCIGRERVFLHFSHLHGTAGRLFRLNYAIDMRYGVLHDVARKVMTGEPVDLSMGHVNVIWQGDANAAALRCLAHATSPTSPLNVSGPETVSIRWLARRFAQLLGREPVLTGAEAPSGWLVNAASAAALLGYPSVPLERMIHWTADWLARGQPTLDKPTHYEVRDGVF
ncbi:NAD-dependent epimerase/dehydratase family protein [Marinimicrococcus flavescens]|uniref:NAD(P)-dependent oxidoreductase n=1 Tax=Marinimicrococcus flavescens TaxID=3031815 RepID=A0AAP3UYN7_9PROT|nr:NAD(P)-dependent oxidoreductase [Marinimicrococcus flavescens]